MVEWLGYAMHLFPPVILIKNEDEKKKKKNEDGSSQGSDKVWPWPFIAQLSAFRRKTRVTWGGTFPSWWKHSAVGAQGTRVSKESILCREHFDCGVNQVTCVSQSMWACCGALSLTICVMLHFPNPELIILGLSYLDHY